MDIQTKINKAKHPDHGFDIIANVGKSLPEDSKKIVLKSLSQLIKVMTSDTNDPEMQALRAKNFIRGKENRQEALKNCYSVKEVAELLNMTTVGVTDRIKAHKLLSIKEKGQHRIPQWQFDFNEKNKVVSGLEKTIKAMTGFSSDVGKILWLSRSNETMGKAPIDLLREGDHDFVISEARAIGAEAE